MPFLISYQIKENFKRQEKREEFNASGKDISKIFSSLSVFIFLAHIPAIPLRHWSELTVFLHMGQSLDQSKNIWPSFTGINESNKFTKTIPIFDLNSSLSRHFDKLQIQVIKEWLNNMLISSFGFFKFN
jgi:hypothetical protein